MKKNRFTPLLALLFIGSCLAANAQKFAPMDPSPLDISYYPSGASMESKPALIKVIYSRPYKKGREIFGKLEPFGKVWRAGANEETEIKFYKPATIAGKTIPAGTYSLFILPEKDSWTFIINKQVDHWGAYSYDKSLDVVRAKVSIKKPTSPIENFSISFTDSGVLVAGWDSTFAELPIKF
jgi:hypothetical protein